MTRGLKQFAGGTPSGNGSDVGVSEVRVENQSRAEISGYSSPSTVPAQLLIEPEMLYGVNVGASITPNCATLRAQGQRVSGPGVKMARRRYQKGSIRRRGNQWTLRWREDVVTADGTTKREQRTTLLGACESRNPVPGGAE
jgi:hypothetical protein